MKNRILFLIFAMVLPLAMLAQQRYVVTTQELNVRTAPSANSKVVDKVRQGDIVSVVSINNGWAKIVYKKKERYVSSKYLSRLEDNSNQNNQNSFNGQGHNYDLIVLKNGHNIQGKVIEVNKEVIIYQPKDNSMNSSVNIAAVQYIRYSNGAQKNFTSNPYQTGYSQSNSSNLSTPEDFKRWGAWMRIGPGQTNLFDDISEKGLSLYCVHLGASYLITKNVPIRFGIGYVGRSSSNRYMDAQMHSLNIPVKIGYRFPFSSNVGIMIQGGLDVDYMLKGTVKVGENSSSRETYSFKEMSDNSNFQYDDFGFGANATLTLCLWDFEISGEYGIGFNDRVSKEKEKYWCVSIGWGFQ